MHRECAVARECALQVHADCIRNACIIAHVDHGKTCLADCLISSNGVISSRLAGKMRYMDSREYNKAIMQDEQVRGITMKTSAITLMHGRLLVNLIDSPGHVDFSGEVSAALFLSDIAVLVIDVVEGVCSQTEFLLRKAINLNLDTIVVFNKLDRLFIDLRQNPAEAFAHLRRLTEQVNSCISQIVSGTLVEEEDWHGVDTAEQVLHLCPEKDNVIFASALHGYGFSLSDFANIWSPKLSISVGELQSKLFSDSYLSKGVIKPEADRHGKKALFEQLVLQPLWDVHKCGLVEGDFDKLKVLAAKMNVKVRSRRLADAFDEFMRGWLPLSSACMRAIARSTSARCAFSRANRLASLSLSEGHPMYEVVRACSEDSLTVVYLAKVLQFSDKITAICRVLSGRIAAGDTLFAVGDKGKENGESLERRKVLISGVYMLMGRERVPIRSALAGAVCAIELNEGFQSCTLCSEALSMGLARPTQACEPLVRVSVRSLGDSDDWQQLRHALKQLSVLDPTLRVIEQENGELAMLTAGEVHLQKCLKDLSDMGQTNIEVSEPIVSFQETIVAPLLGTASGSHETECSIRGGVARLKLRAVPLPSPLVKLLERSEDALRSLREGIFENAEVCSLKTVLWDEGVRWLKQMKGTWWSRRSEQQLRQLLERIWAFGPPRARLNILFNAIDDYARPPIWEKSSSRFRCFDQSMVAGFDLIMSAGPLCEEPMIGVGIVVEEWTVSEEDDPTMAGALISAMKQACKAALNKHPLRLVAAMYKCIVQTSGQALGKVHAVLSQRRAKVINEDLNQASGLFVVEAFMPIIESFSFCEQLRKRTSGMASGQLEFSHWEVLDEDPFWEPTTEDEVELYGVKGDSISRVRSYMDALRKRKGLLTDELIVVNAEKQRNLKRNK
ncbi:Elongation factor 2 [Toxocara canis]|uniref:Elongation factor-like 1 n=1 Tax=Toxocara canis TaxID=6265 RepID=A0A0B2W0K0_TOXCA|nr:Elongation factor 2 [Toxocara canis]